jgi:hypothetical protein
MKRWCVETRVVINRVYFVEADDEKSAEEATCEAYPDLDEELNEETISITEAPIEEGDHGTDGLRRSEQR